MNRVIKRIDAVSILILFALSLGVKTPFIQASSNTLLSLEPKSIIIPYIELGRSSQLLIIEMDVSDVENLKQHYVEFNFNGEILSYFGGQMVFRLLVGGSTGSPLGAIYPNTFTGSTTMYQYAFKILKPGFTSIDLVNTQLKDDLGNEISHSVSGCNIHIMEYVEWADQQYSDLETSYNLLQSSHSDLQSGFQYLDSTHTSLLSDYADLLSNHDELEEVYSTLSEQHIILDATYNGLYAEFENLDVTYSELLIEHEELNYSFIQLESEFNILSNDYIEKNQAHFEIEQELTHAHTQLESTRSLFLLSTTFALVFFIIIFSNRRHIFA